MLQMKLSKQIVCQLDLQIGLYKLTEVDLGLTSRVTFLSSQVI